MRKWLRRWLFEGDDPGTQWGHPHGRTMGEVNALLSGILHELDALRGRLTAAENSAAAANSRAERQEAALARLEGRVAELESAVGLNVRFIPKVAVDPARPGSDVTVSTEVPSCGS